MGRGIDFKNTLLILTTNVGTERIVELSSTADYRENVDALATAMRPNLLQVFPAALLGRIVTIPYFPLSPKMLGDIVGLQLGRIAKRTMRQPSSTTRRSSSILSRSAMIRIRVDA
jgi:type VI secretion system protein VasG